MPFHSLHPGEQYLYQDQLCMIKATADLETSSVNRKEEYQLATQIAAMTGNFSNDTLSITTATI